jgi:hypothetical protein
MLIKLIRTFIVIFALVSLITIISKQINTTNTDFQSSQVILKSIVLFFVLAIMGIAMWVISSAFQDIGVMGEESVYKEPTEELTKEKPHKQTYSEYVKERLDVENMIHNS